MISFRNHKFRSPAIFQITWKGILVVLIVVLFTLANASAQELDNTSALSVAEALVDAFNQHDPDAMAALVAPDFELYYVDEEGVAGLAVSGPDQLAAEMATYFTSHPSVQSTIAAAIDGPVYTSFREQIVGGQSSLAVYEVRDGLIKRVWYFPAE